MAFVANDPVNKIDPFGLQEGLPCGLFGCSEDQEDEDLVQDTVEVFGKRTNRTSSDGNFEIMARQIVNRAAKGAEASGFRNPTCVASQSFAGVANTTAAAAGLNDGVIVGQLGGAAVFGGGVTAAAGSYYDVASGEYGNFQNASINGGIEVGVAGSFGYSSGSARGGTTTMGSTTSGGVGYAAASIQLSKNASGKTDFGGAAGGGVGLDVGLSSGVFVQQFTSCGTLN